MYTLSNMKREALRVTSTIPVAPTTLYFAWIDSDHHSSMTGGAAKLDPTVGAKYSTLDGYVGGKLVILDLGRRIVMSWRTNDFPREAPDSRVEVHFETLGPSTRILILHTDIPEGQSEKYKALWNEKYIGPMRSYFSKFLPDPRNPPVRRPPPPPPEGEEEDPEEEMDLPTKLKARFAEKKAAAAAKLAASKPAPAPRAPNPPAVAAAPPPQPLPPKKSVPPVAPAAKPSGPGVHKAEKKAAPAKVAKKTAPAKAAPSAKKKAAAPAKKKAAAPAKKKAPAKPAPKAAKKKTAPAKKTAPKAKAKAKAPAKKK